MPKWGSATRATRPWQRSLRPFSFFPGIRSPIPRLDRRKTRQHIGLTEASQEGLRKGLLPTSVLYQDPSFPFSSLPLPSHCFLLQAEARSTPRPRHPPDHVVHGTGQAGSLGPLHTHTHPNRRLPGQRATQCPLQYTDSHTLLPACACPT